VRKLPTTVKRLARTARWTELRLRTKELLARAFLLLPIPLLYAVGALTVIKVARLGIDTQATLLWFGMVPLAIFAGGVLQVWLRRQPRFRGALALDRHHGLDDRITNALSFHGLPSEQRTPLMQVAIEDALGVAVELRPRRAAPLHLPRELPIVCLLVAGLVGIALLEVRTVRALPPERRIEPLVMTADDIELFRHMAEKFEGQSQDPEALAAARRFNQLIEDIANRRLDRREVFQRLEELERELLRSAEAEQEALEEGMGNLARQLETSPLSKPIAEAFQEKRLADAEEAMRKLAERLKKRQGRPSKTQLDRLREALKKAGEANSGRLQRLEQERRRVEEQRQRLLQKKRDSDAGLSKRDQRQLDKLERRLERLDRQRDRAQRAARKFSKLDRELAQAAADLLQQAGVTAQDLEAAAQDINRMAEEELSRKEKEDLRRRLQELRELIRQQGKGGKERLRRLMRFGQRARGQQGNKGGQSSGKAGKLGGKGGDTLLITRGGRGGAPIPLPGGGSGSDPGGAMSGSGQGRGGDQPGGQGAGQGGKSWGTGHDPNLKGAQSGPMGTTQDVSAAGVDTGEGTASAEVIYGAAERGFVGSGYRKVYTDYRHVAEQVMTQDEIPAGYRFYVQRYFQLIRPRE
jgi:hypothetical protein